MYTNQYYDYYQVAPNTSGNHYVDFNNGSLNNSTGYYNDSGYNNSYWYSKSDNSSSSIETNESTSPILSRQINYYTSHNHDYSNASYQNKTSSPKIQQPIVVNVSSIVENDDYSVIDKSVEDKFNKEILPLLNGETSNGLKRRMRTAFSDDQRKYLMKIFEKTIYPNKEQLEQLSKKLSVTPTIIQTWFKNMRAKKKKNTKIVY